MPMPESDQSAFNMAVAYLKRIDTILNHCVFYSQRDDIHNWLRKVRALYRELSIVKLLPEQQTELDNAFKEIYLIYNKGINNMSRNRLLLKIDKLEIMLRRIAQQKGMLLAKKDDPRYAVLKR